MQVFLIIVHVIACLFLIAVILLQAGRGGGLSDIAGGSQAQSILGTETNAFMKRMTEVFAVIFIVTSLSLGIVSTHRGKSLIEQKRMSRDLQKKVPLPAEVQKAIEKSEAASQAAAKTAQEAVKPAEPAVAVATTPAPQASSTAPETKPAAPAAGNAK